MYRLNRRQAGEDPLSLANLVEQPTELDEDVKIANELAEKGNLFGTSVSRLVSRVTSEYTSDALGRMNVGRTHNPWTVIKITKICRSLEAVIERANLECMQYEAYQGEQLMGDFITEIENFKSEVIPALRIEYKDDTDWLPGEGTLETVYIPLVECGIKLIYRIYTLYQITNKLQSDLGRMAFLSLAHNMAEYQILILLHRLDKDNFQKADAFLAEIEAVLGRSLIINEAASHSLPSQRNQIDIKLLTYINSLFERRRDRNLAQAISVADQNLGFRAKQSVYHAYTATASAVTSLSSVTTQVGNLVLDAWTGTRSTAPSPFTRPMLREMDDHPNIDAANLGANDHSDDDDDCSPSP